MNAAPDQAQQLTNLWIDFAMKMASTGIALRPGEQTPPEVGEQLREANFAAMAQYADKFMRSQPFLEMMKQSLDASITFRKQLNEFLTEAHHSVQGVARQDVDATALAIRHLETRVLDRIETLSARLDEVNRRLAAVEATRVEEAMINGNGAEAFLEKWSLQAADNAAATLRRMARVPFLWQRAQRVKKGATPSEVVYEEDRLKLLHYKSDTPPQFKTPLVFVFALVNRPYILDLKEGKSVVEHFVRRGFDTYLVDWGTPTDADRHLTLDDYINGYMPNVIDYVCERTSQPQASILGYCMGGTMSAMFTALHQSMVRNLILLAAGIDFASRDGLLQLWCDEKVFDVDGFVDAFGNAPPQFLQGSFQMLRPVSNLLEKPLHFFEQLEDEEFVDDYFAMEGWLNDNIPVPGEVFRQFVKYLYQQNRLTQGTMPVGKHTVDLKAITCPVLNLMAQKDDLVPCSQSSPFNDLVGSTDRKAIQFPAGHIGLAVGSKAQRELWPQACDWLAVRSDPA